MPRGSGACSTQRGTMPGRAPPRRPRGDPTPGRRRPAPRAPSGHALGPDAVPRRRITDDAATQLLPSSPGRRNTTFPEDESPPPLGNTPPSRNVVLGKRRARRPSCVDPRDSGVSRSSGPKRTTVALGKSTIKCALSNGPCPIRAGGWSRHLHGRHGGRLGSSEKQ